MKPHEITLHGCGARLVAADTSKTILKGRDKKGDMYTAIVPNKDYKNDGVYTGIPLYLWGEQDKCASKLFSMITCGTSFTDCYTGVCDWSCRKEWLACFTEDEKRFALDLERELKEIVTIEISRYDLATVIAAAYAAAYDEDDCEWNKLNKILTELKSKL